MRGSPVLHGLLLSLFALHRPAPGVDLLLVEDGSYTAETWEVAFACNGYENYDLYTTLLYDWLDQSTRQVGLWLLGNKIAVELNGDGWYFLTTTIGANWIGLIFSSPNARVDAVHPDLEYLGDQPWFWLNALCPHGGRFDQISVNNALATVTLTWYMAGDIGDVAGREVSRLWDGKLPAGEHKLRWDGRNGKGDADQRASISLRVIVPPQAVRRAR